MDENWQERFLRSYAVTGAKWRAAKVAGVSKRTVDAYEAVDPVFAERMADALELYADRLETKMVKQAEERGNPVGFIVRLKALRPDKYIERHAVMNLSVNVNDATPQDATDLLRTMLGDATPATRQRLSAPPGAPALSEGSGMGTGEIIDVEPSETRTEAV